MEEKIKGAGKTNRRKGIIIAAVCLAVILAAAVGVYAYTQGHKNDQAKEDKPGTETEKKEEALPDPTNVTDEASLRKLLAADGAIDITVTGEVRTAKTFEVKGNKTLRGQGAVAADYDIGVAKPLINVKKGASLTVDGLRLDGAGAATVISVDEGARLSHVSGRIEYAGGFALSVAGEAALSAGTEVYYSSDGALHVLEDGNVTVDGGTYKENGNYGLMVSPGGRCEINGEPVFDGAMRAIVWNQGETRIYGGTYTNSRGYGIRNRANMTVDYRGAKKGGMIEISNTEDYGMYVETTTTLYVYDVLFRNMTGGYCFRKTQLAGIVRVKNCIFDRQTHYNWSFGVEGGNVVMDNVEVMHSGGGMYFKGGGSITLRDVKIHDLSTSAQTTGWGTGGGSDAIRADGPTVKGERVTIWNIGGAPLNAQQVSTGGDQKIFYPEYAAFDMRDLKVNGSGKIHIYTGCSLKITDSLISGRTDAPTNNVGIQIDKDATCVMDDTVIRGSTGRGVIVNGGVFTMNSGKICDNRLTEKSSDTTGGAVYILKSGSPGRFIMNGGEITGNENVYDGTDYSRQRGAAVCVFDSSTFVLNDGKIYKNRGGQGPILVRNKSVMTMNGGKIYENNARQGGAVLLLNNARMDINGGAVSDNFAVGDSGGILVTNTSTLNLKGGKISDNRADTSIGGGINVDVSSTLNFSGGSVEDNTAGKNGGGIRIADTSTARITGGRISGNSAGGSGGGVYVSKGTINLSDVVIEGNHAASGGGIYIGNTDTTRITGGKISENEASNEGGGISAAGGFSVKNCVFEGNRAGIDEMKNGGAIFATGGAKKIVTVSGCTFNGNRSEKNCGGAICNSGVTLTVKDGCIFEDNYCQQQGGAIYQNNAEAVTNITGGIFKANTTDGWGNGGAAIMVANGKTGEPCLAVTDTVFEDNIQNCRAQSRAGTDGGGAVYLMGNDLSATFTATKSGIKFSGNRAETGSGGAIYVRQFKELTVEGYEFEGNEAIAVKTNKEDTAIGGFGGAIYTASPLKLKDCSFGDKDAKDADAIAAAANKATSVTVGSTIVGGAGGAVYVDKDVAATVTGGSFTGNYASNEGGAMYTKGASTDISSVTFTANTSDTRGGALSSWTDLTVDGSTFEKNECGSSNGGAIFITGASRTVNISLTAFEENKSTKNCGGAIGLSDGTLNIKEGCLFEKNSCPQQGGAIYQNTANSVTNIRESTFRGNTIDSWGHGGAAIMVTNGKKEQPCLAVTDTVFEDNIQKAAPEGKRAETDGGGAVYLMDSNNRDLTATFTATKPGIKFSGNRAETGSGGAIYVTNFKELTVTGYEFEGNEAIAVKETDAEDTALGGFGGAIYTASPLKLKDCSFGDEEAEGADAIAAAGNKATSVTFDVTKNGKPTPTTFNGIGGAVYVDKVDKDVAATVTGGSFTGNRAYEGGAMYTKGTTTDISGVTFTANTSDSRGGALSSYTMLNVSDSTFEKNECGSSNGGAIFITGASKTVNILGTTFKDNKSTKNCGGAIGLSDGRLNIKEACLFEGNYSRQHGGAIYQNTANSVTNITGSTFKGNTTDSDACGGGAIMVINGKANEDCLVVTDTVFENNIQHVPEGKRNNNAKNNGGGAVYIGKAGNTDQNAISATFTATKDGIKFSGNKSETGSGGAIFAGDLVSKVTVTGYAFEGNEAATVMTDNNDASIGGSGGAIYSLTSLTVFGCSFTNNKAAVDGGAICTKNLTLQKNDNAMVTFTGNTAGGKGTAIAIMQGGTLTGQVGDAYTLADGTQTVYQYPAPTKAAKKKTGTAVKKTSAKTK